MYAFLITSTALIPNFFRRYQFGSLRAYYITYSMKLSGPSIYWQRNSNSILDARERLELGTFNRSGDAR